MLHYDHNDHYTQAGDLYRLLSEEERTRLVANIVGAMKPVERDEIKLRQIGISTKPIQTMGNAHSRRSRFISTARSKIKSKNWLRRSFNYEWPLKHGRIE